MSDDGWMIWLEWLTTGTAGFVGYWLILIAVAGLEVAQPGRQPQASGQRPSGHRIATNLGLGLIASALNSIPLLSEVAMAQVAIQQGWGLLNQWTGSAALKVAASFIACDLLAYAVHRLSHSWPPLWRLHRVHHADSHIDLSTLFRIHPLTIPVLMGINFTAIVALGIHPLGILLHGAVKLVTMGLGHASVAPRPGLSRIVAWLFVTPAFHHRHHSAFQPETDSNYSEVLTLWDRLFGTFTPSTNPIARIGLGALYDDGAGSLPAQLKLPFQS